MKLRVPLLAFALALTGTAPAHASDVGDAARAARAPAAQLERVDAVRSLGTRFVRFRQEAGGVPVLGGEAVVSDTPGSRDLLVDHTRAHVDAPAPPRVSRAAAVRAARRAARVRELRSAVTASPALLPRPGGREELVWRVVLPSARPLGSFEVLVDAGGGRVVRVRDLLRHVDGTARLFDPNPVEEQGSVAGLSDDTTDPDSGVPTTLYRPVTLHRLNSSGTCLIGPRVAARLAGSTVCGGPDWTAVRRHDDRFEALMAYFHIDRTQAYIESLGFMTVMNRAIRVNANGSTM